jgi:hypothetical protein
MPTELLDEIWKYKFEQVSYKTTQGSGFGLSGLCGYVQASFENHEMGLKCLGGVADFMAKKVRESGVLKTGFCTILDYSME